LTKVIGPAGRGYLSGMSIFREKDGRPMPDMAVGTMRLGRWGADLDTAGFRGFIEACLEAGLDLFDHADIYGDYTTEEAFGRALAEASGLRDRLRLVTKCGIQLVTENRPSTRLKHYDTSAGHLRASVEASLAALRTDRIDLLLVHRPDPLMDPHAIADAFAGLREAGKVRAFGVSNFSPAQVAALRAVAFAGRRPGAGRAGAPGAEVRGGPHRAGLRLVVAASVGHRAGDGYIGTGAYPPGRRRARGAPGAAGLVRPVDRRRRRGTLNAKRCPFIHRLFRKSPSSISCTTIGYTAYRIPFA
jgi:hypothetical protein